MKSLVLSLFIMITSLIVGTSCSHFGKKSYDARLTNFPYPFKVEIYQFKSQKQKLEMAYMDLGPKDAEETYILFHGKNFSGYYWEKIAKLLKDRGHRVIIPDQIGFGKSSKPEFYQYSLEQLALNTHGLVQSLKIEKYHLIGHSMGGMVATKFNKLYPNEVEKMILINPIGLEKYLDYVDYKDPQTFYEAELAKTADKIKAYQRRNYYNGDWNEQYDQLIEAPVGQLYHSDYPLVAWNNALTYGPIFTNPIVDDFKEIENPIVLIIGTRDRTGPGRGFKREGVSYKLGEYQKLGKEIYKLIQNGKLIELTDLGHMPQFEDWERFKPAFLHALKEIK